MNISESKVLVVDDEIDLAELVTESFELEGFDVKMALSGDEALQKCRSEHFHVILSDNHMPGLSGAELFQALKKESKSPFLFYLCSGDLDLNRDDFKAEGGADLISKPYDLFELIDRIGEDLKTL